MSALVPAAGRSLSPTDVIPDGVYLNLDDEIYFAQDALGSTDLIKLFKLKYGWWWQSKHNPGHVDKRDPARRFGTALHAILLEGLGAYEARYVVQPDRPADAIETIDSIKAAIAKAGFALTGVSKWVAADWHAAARANIPEVPCWPNILADFTESVGRRTILSPTEDRMIRLMRDAALESPEIAPLIKPAVEVPMLSEVAILTTNPDGTRRRRKLDLLLPAFNLDLKTLGNWSGRPLAWAVGDHIARYGYDIQRADYDDGRRDAYRLIAEGKLFGGTPEQRRWIGAFPEKFPAWDWVWLFYQKPEPTGRAPVLFPLYDSSGSDIHRFGANKLIKAMAFYHAAVARFGLDRPWTDVEPLHFTDEETARANGGPQVFFPHWIADEEPTDDAAFADR